MGRRRFSWSPPKMSAHLDLPAVPSGVGTGGATTGWSSNPNDHIVVYKPPCVLCQAPAMRWRRCGCGETIGLCNAECSQSGAELDQALRDHRLVCTWGN